MATANNQYKPGNDHGYEDGLRGRRRSYRYKKNSTQYAMRTYKDGYSAGYNQGAIRKKQNDSRSRQMARNKRSKKVAPQSQGCLGLLLFIIGSCMAFILW